MAKRGKGKENQKQSRNNQNNKIEKLEIMNHNSISEERYIQLQTEAIYKALMLYEERKKAEPQVNKKIDEPNEKGKIRKVKKFIKDILLCVNVLLFPFHIFDKNIRINEHVYDQILVIPITILMHVVGICMWFSGIASIWNICTKGLGDSYMILATVVMFFLGSLMVLGAKAFSKEKDSMKVYAFTASLIALVSCVVSVVALIVK